jgi:hypothetical protein
MFQPSPPQPPQYPPPRGGLRLPTWLMALLFAVGFVVVGGGIFWYFGQSPQKTSAVIVSPDAKPGATDSPAQPYIEVTGLRFAPDTKGVKVTFVLINHSDSDLANLAGDVTVLARTQKAEEDPMGTFSFQAGMAAKSSKELTLPLNTKLKLVNMPDWQNCSVKVHITAPPGA